MRDPNRIDKIVELLREAWHLQPGYRLTQLVMILADQPGDAGALWHVTDDTLEQKLRANIAGLKRFLDEHQQNS